MNSRVGRIMVILILVAFVGLMVLPLFLPTSSPGILPDAAPV